MKTKIREIVIFAMLGAIFFVSKIVMEAFPNIHLLAVFTIVYTIVYRKKAIIPIMIGVMMLGIFYGFSIWWIPYLYIWPLLYFATLLIPTTLNKKVLVIMYSILCFLSGITYGTLYGVFWGLISKFTIEQYFMWVAAGLGFDLIMAIGNLCLSILIVPISSLMLKLIAN